MREEERGETELVASATECTGLVSALQDAEGEEALRGLYDVHRAKKPGPTPSK